MRRCALRPSSAESCRRPDRRRSTPELPCLISLISLNSHRAGDLCRSDRPRETARAQSAIRCCRFTRPASSWPLMSSTRWPSNSAGRSNGVPCSYLFVKLPCRSGSPHGVFGGAFAPAAGLRPASCPAIGTARRRHRSHRGQSPDHVPRSRGHRILLRVRTIRPSSCHRSPSFREEPRPPRWGALHATARLTADHPATPTAASAPVLHGVGDGPVVHASGAQDVLQTAISLMAFVREGSDSPAAW